MCLRCCPSLVIPYRSSGPKIAAPSEMFFSPAFKASSTPVHLTSPTVKGWAAVPEDLSTRLCSCPNTRRRVKSSLMGTLKLSYGIQQHPPTGA